MDELIKQLTDRLGIDSATAEGITGKAMGLIKENVDDSTFSQLASSLPGVEALIGSADDEGNAGDGNGSGGGMLGSLAGMASSIKTDATKNRFIAKSLLRAASASQ